MEAPLDNNLEKQAKILCQILIENMMGTPESQKSSLPSERKSTETQKVGFKRYNKENEHSNCKETFGSPNSSESIYERLIEVQNSLKEKIKSLDSFPNKQENEENWAKVSTKIEHKSSDNSSCCDEQFEGDLLDQNSNLSKNYMAIRKMLNFMMENIGKLTSSKMAEQRASFTMGDPTLEQIFDSLLQKYVSSSKTKEEKIKFVLRKSFKFLKERIENRGNLSKKEIDLKFLQMYFRNHNADPSKKADSLEHYDVSIKDIIMPFRKKSVNKTMNHGFLKKIFSYEKFSICFLSFLKEFVAISYKDNVKKINNTAKKFATLIQCNQFKNFNYRKFKRLPWLHIWIKEAHETAKLLSNYSNINFPKEQNSPNSEPRIQKKRRLSL